MCALTNGDHLRRLVAEIPKAELHFHVDTPYPDLILRVAKRNGVELPFTDVEGFDRWVASSTGVKDLLERIWVGSNRPFQHEEDYCDLILDMGKRMESETILRREAFFGYGYAHESRGVPLEVVCKGLAKGRKAVKEQYGLDVFFTAELDRRIDPKRNLALVNALVEYKEETGILAIGTEGIGEGNPILDQKDALLRARELGFRLTGHMCESCGPEYLWDYLREIGMDRIDHGVRAIEDEALVDHIAQLGLALTCCPGTNIMIPGYENVKDLPYKRFMERGIPVTINTDAPSWTRISLTDSYLMVADAFDLSLKELAGFARNSLTYSFATDEEKKGYLRRLDAWLGENMPGEA